MSILKSDIVEAFSITSLKSILAVVVLNIFLSYGCLYLSNWILIQFPSLDFLMYGAVSSVLISNAIIGSSFATIFISPIFEELFFRGILINKLYLIVPMTFSILISSLLFAALHTFGSLISAFVFAICMAILYIKTENIVVAILAHFLNNLIAETIVTLDAGNILFTNDFVMLAISVLAVVSAVILLISIVGELNNLKY